MKTPNGRIRFTCTPAVRTSTSVESYELSNLLDTLSNREAVSFRTEIEIAISGGEFEEFYSIDQADSEDIIQFVPPNVILNEKYKIGLVDLMLLLDEWILFCETR